jgi:hypothetical protein
VFRPSQTSSLEFGTLNIPDGRFIVVSLPNITDVFYGRDVGYNIERIVLDQATETISATDMRKLATAP